MDRISWFNRSARLDRDLQLLLFSMSARRVAMGFLGVVRAIYFALIGFDPITIGLLLSIATFVSAFHHISFGILSDRYGRKPFLLLGAIASTARFVIFAVTQDFWLLVLGQSLGAMGEGVGAGQPVVSGYLTEKVETEKRVSVFSTFAISNAVTAAIGAAIAGLPHTFQTIFSMSLVEAHTPLFSIGIVLCLLSFVLLLPLKETTPTRGEKTRKKKGAFNITSRDTILKYSLVRSTSGLGWGFIQSLLPLYFYMSFGVGSDILGPIYASSRLLSIFTYPLIPHVIARLGEVKALATFRMVSVGVTMAFATTGSYYFASILLVVLRVVLMFTIPIRQSLATKLVNPKETATAIGVSNFARMGARSAAPTMAGYMFEAITLSTPFFIGGALMFLNGLLYYTYFANLPQQKTN